VRYNNFPNFFFLLLQCRSEKRNLNVCRNSAVRSLRIDALPSCGSLEQELMRQPGYNIMTSAVVTTVGQYTLLIAILFLVAFVALLLVVRD
jgi:hypothetical protein